MRGRPSGWVSGGRLSVMLVKGTDVRYDSHAKDESGEFTLREAVAFL